MTPDQLQALGTSQKPTKDQESYIRALIRDASTALYELSDRRVKIEPFDYVDNIKNADLIISLTGDPGRGGWATPGGIEGRPGQIGLYYKVLEQTPQEQSALTVAHEISHYIYALPDEYQDGVTRGLCPESNPSGPGCLMDNYFLRHGDYGRYCDSDHNSSAPNPGTLAHEHTQQQSCKYWVDRFFQLRPPASTDSSEEVKADVAAISSDQPFTGRFRALVSAATTYSREKIADGKIGFNRRTADPGPGDLDRVKNIARIFLDAQLKLFGNDPDFVKPTSSQKNKALDIIARNAFNDPVGGLIEATNVLGQNMISKLKVKARELASEELAEIPGSGGLIQNLLSSDRSGRDRLKKFQPAIKKIKDLLVKYLKESAGFQVASAPGPNTLGPQEERLVEKIAREAVVGTADTSSFAILSEAAKLHIRLSLITAQNLIDVSSDLDVPGVENRTQELKQYNEQLSKFALPGKLFFGFGRRRTLILAPPPLYPDKDIVRIDAGDSMPYERIRLLAISQLTKLIERERIEEIEQRLPDDLNKLSSGDRFRVFNKMVNATTDNVRRNRAENIILISPPGGLPTELSDELEGLRARIQRNGDVRLDVIEMFDGNIPLRLRDGVYQSGGTVQFAADVDELGAVAQRLKNDISAGSWVTYPEQGTIDLTQATADNQNRAGQNEAVTPDYWRDLVTLYGGEPTKPRDGLLSDFQTEINDDLLEVFNFISEQLIKQQVKPVDFDNFRSFYSSLYKLMGQLETTRSALKDLRLGNFAEPTERAQKAVRAAKETIHSIFWKSSQDEAFLSRTDDALDGQLRCTLRERARVLEGWAKQNEDAAHKLQEQIDSEKPAAQPQEPKTQSATQQPDGKPTGITQSVATKPSEQGSDEHQHDKQVLLDYFASQSRWSSLRAYSRAASLYQVIAEYNRGTRDLQRKVDQHIARVRTAARSLRTQYETLNILRKEKEKRAQEKWAQLKEYTLKLMPSLNDVGDVPTESSSTIIVAKVNNVLGLDLRLMSSLNDESAIPTEGKNLIIVAEVNNVLHFRIFDGDGKVVVDTDEKRLTEQAPQIKDLRKQLESLWPLHDLAQSDKDRVTTAVTSIVVHTHIKDLKKQLESLWPPHELTQREKNGVITAIRSIVFCIRVTPAKPETAKDSDTSNASPKTQEEDCVKSAQSGVQEPERYYPYLSNSNLTSGPVLSALMTDTENRITALKHEIEILEKEILTTQNALSLQATERLFNVKVSSDDLVSAADNLVHFIELVLDIHKYNEKEAFLKHMHYDHELLTVLDELERAAENNPDPHRLKVVVESLQSLVEEIESVKPKCSDPADKSRSDAGLAKDLFKIEANRVQKRLEDLRTRSMELLRNQSTARQSKPSSTDRRTAPLENPIATLVNLYKPTEKATDPPSSGSPSPYMQRAGLFKGGLFTYDYRLIPQRKPEPSTSLTDNRVRQLYSLFKSIANVNKSTRREVSEVRASRESLALVLYNRGLNSPGSRLSLEAFGFLKQSTIFGNRENQEVDELLTDWIEQWVDEIYLMTLHNIHERLRDLDKKLSQLAQTNVFERPVFERLKERRPPATVKLLPPSATGQMMEVEFKPFQAEEGADYELVLGLSRPLIDFEKLRSNVEENPQIQLYDDNKLLDRPYLRLEPDFSSDTMLVFRIPKPNLRAGLLGQGKYTPKLLIKRDYMPLVGGDGRIGYTFTVGTKRPNVQIIASLRQPQPKEAGRDPAKDPEEAFRGVLAANQFDAIVEAEVFAGAPVLNADVSSVLQRVEKTNLAIATPNYQLRDDGIYPDLLKDDGIYTARITLQPAARRKAAEYRVFVEARSNKDVKFYPLVDPVINAQAKPAKQKEPPPVPPFQRSTSLNFHAAQES
jgi:hypothetical protein